nr:helix-turn-helix transcriptional regulator [Dechloromonas sp.]
MKLGEAIARIRIDRGLSQDELADLCETSKTSVSRIEADKQWPSRELLDRLARELDVYVYQLFVIAEGVDIPVVYESENDRAFRIAMQALDAQDRYMVEAMATRLAAKK